MFSRQDEVGKRELMLLAFPSVFSSLFFETYISIFLLISFSLFVIFSNWKIYNNEYSILNIFTLVFFLSGSFLSFFIFSESGSQSSFWQIDGLVIISLLPFVFGYAFGSPLQWDWFRWASVFVIMISTWVGLVGLLSSALFIVLFLIPWVFSQHEKETIDLNQIDIRKFTLRFFPALGLGYVAITLFSTLLFSI